MPKPKPSRGAYWCWTLNNPTKEEIRSLVQAQRTQERVTYICWGVELGESGTPHLQGYLELESKQRLGGVKKLPGFSRAHLEIRQGSQKQAVDYCRKDGHFFEHGSPRVSQQGKRSDLDAIKELLDVGTCESDVADQYFGQWCRYRKSFSAYRDLQRPVGLRDVEVFFLWGLAGSGKTGFVYQREPELWISSDPTLQWFDGYSGEEAVLLDDYRGDASTSFILRVLDRYPLKVPVKGSFTNWTPKRIYITSNADPTSLHGDASAAWLRRIKKTVHFTGNLDFDDPDAIARIAGMLE